MREEQEPKQSEILIRKADSQDIEIVAELRLLSLLHTVKFNPDFTSNEDIINKDVIKKLHETIQKDFDSQDIAYFLACCGGETVGIATVEFPAGVDGTAFLTDFFVRQEYRKKEIGTKLFHKAIQLAKKKDYSRLSLMVAERNIEAQKVFRKLGFRPKKSDNTFLILERKI